MKKVLFLLFVTICIPFIARAQYVDLGLKSGTLWKSTNENGYYSYDQAVREFGNQLPRKGQMEELVNSCEWTWTGDGYDVTGPNGNKIFLSADGYTSCDDGKMYDGGLSGFYWSLTPKDDENAWLMDLYEPSVQFASLWREDHYLVVEGWRCRGRSVRLVKSK